MAIVVANIDVMMAECPAEKPFVATWQAFTVHQPVLDVCFGDTLDEALDQAVAEVKAALVPEGISHVTPGAQKNP